MGPCENCEHCRRLHALLTRDRMAERVTIWHEGGDKPDQVFVGIAHDLMEPMTGVGESLGAAITDLERRIKEEGGL